MADKVAIITGGGGVLGGASAAALAARGYDIVVTGRTGASSRSSRYAG